MARQQDACSHLASSPPRQPLSEAREAGAAAGLAVTAAAPPLVVVPPVVGSPPSPPPDPPASARSTAPPQKTHVSIPTTSQASLQLPSTGPTTAGRSSTCRSSSPLLSSSMAAPPSPPRVPSLRSPSSSSSAALTTSSSFSSSSSLLRSESTRSAAGCTTGALGAGGVGVGRIMGLTAGRPLGRNLAAPSAPRPPGPRPASNRSNIILGHRIHAAQLEGCMNQEALCS